MMKENRKSLFWIGGLILLIVLFQFVQQHPAWIEQYYSLGFYPIFSYIPKFLFGWIPFSFGDLLYAALFLAIIFLIIRILIALFQKKFKKACSNVLKLTILLLATYVYFYSSWALNYFRIPISEQLNLQTDSVRLEDHLTLLAYQIQKANDLRKEIDYEKADRQQVHKEIQKLMLDDRDFPMLSKTQVQIKYPISSTLSSFFGVSGYFNPFSQEAHINGKMPLASYPFTVSHELAHQMGIGFEDECNFIAYVKLRNHPNPWYAYAAYYESINYLLRSLYLVDKKVFQTYRDRLSPEVLEDMKAEQEFWNQYTGWIADVSGFFYDGYLKHNNQAEGIARYAMVSRLIIAYEQPLLKVLKANPDQ